MTNIVAFESGKLPAYLTKIDVSELNQDLTSHASSGFPIMSIKGKVFTLSRGDEKTVLPNPKDPDSPATAIDVVIVKVNKGTSKVFYLNGYKEGEQSKPDCFSNNGDKPDAGSKQPQAKSCQACPHNQWGSKIGENGGKGKACQDSVRIAIAPPDQVNDPMLLRVPPASIKALGELGTACAKRGVPYNAAVTKISFDLASATPKLLFKPVGLLDDATFNTVLEVANSDIVRNITGNGFSSEPAPELAAPKAEAEEAPAPKPAAKAKPKVEEHDEEPPKAAVKAKPVDLELGDLNLDELNFDD
jgi:hypothetical protein